MKFDYFTLLSFDPVYMQGIGYIKSPTLKEISRIGIDIYNSYLSLISLNIESYYSLIDKIGESYFNDYSAKDKLNVLNARNGYESLDEERKREYSFFDLLGFDYGMKISVLNALNFFFCNDVAYDEMNRVFLTYDRNVNNNEEKIITGVIDSNTYADVVDCILKRNGINKQDKEQELKFKSELAKEVWELTHKKKDKKQNKDMNLGNIISSVAAKDESLNMINIWNMTIYQLYDQFQRHQGNVYFDIQATSVAAYGDEKCKFDGGAWYKNNYDK